MPNVRVFAKHVMRHDGSHIGKTDLDATKVNWLKTTWNNIVKANDTCLSIKYPTLVKLEIDLAEYQIFVFVILAGMQNNKQKEKVLIRYTGQYMHTKKVLDFVDVLYCYDF